MPDAGYSSSRNSPPSASARTAYRLARCCLLCLLASARNPVCGQTPLNERVLVIYNSSARESLAVAKYYMDQRRIPETNRCRIAVDSADTINQDEFESRVKAPVRKCLDTAGKQKILYIVFSYRTPYVIRIRDVGYALDQFVADIWDEYSPSRPGNEVGAHPYFGEAQSQGNVYAPFVPLATYREQPRASNIYSVWRLDAADANLARGLVDKAIFAETNGLSGKGCFDLQFGGIDGLADAGAASGDWDVHQGAEFARQAGFTVVEDDQRTEFGTPPSPLRCDSAAFYAGWYNLDHYNDAFTWNPGAIGFHLDSASATNPRGGTNWSANAVIKGITVTSGAVGEPFLEGLPHPDQVFLYLFQGANVGDAFLRSTRWLKWMIVNIGDPLYRPFPKGVAPFNLPAHRETWLAIAPHSLVGGDPSFGIVGLSSVAPEGGTTVSLKSNRPDIVSLPQTVTIVEKTNAARFPIITRPVKGDAAAVRVSMAVGDLSRSNTLMLYPLLASVTLSQAKVSGGASIVGTVNLYQPAPAEGVIVTLSSANAALVSVPQEAKIPSGANRATFAITSRAVTAESSSVITASSAGTTRTATLILVP